MCTWLVINPRCMRKGYGSRPVCVCVCYCASYYIPVLYVEQHMTFPTCLADDRAEFLQANEIYSVEKFYTSDILCAHLKSIFRTCARDKVIYRVVIVVVVVVSTKNCHISRCRHLSDS